MTKPLATLPNRTRLDAVQIPYTRLWVCTLDNELISDVARKYTDLEGNVFHSEQECDEYWRGNDFMESLTNEHAA